MDAPARAAPAPSHLSTLSTDEHDTAQSTDAQAAGGQPRLTEEEQRAATDGPHPAAVERQEPDSELSAAARISFAETGLLVFGSLRADVCAGRQTPRQLHLHANSNGMHGPSLYSLSSPPHTVQLMLGAPARAAWRATATPRPG